MGTMREIGLGVSTVLATANIPEPLAIDLWDGDPQEAALLVRSVLAECHDSGLPLKVVRVPILVWDHPTTGRTYPRLQILTLAELFQNKRPNIPLVDVGVGKQAKAEDMNAGKQGSLL